MASGNAHIGKPAPDFTATAVVDGAFKEIKLSDYRGEAARRGNGRGQGLHLKEASTNFSSALLFPREVRGPLFLSTGLHFCLPHGDHRF
ncbi:rCG51106, isoform CRA_c [Rattus norvegicus]|uniref:RCG51106, isoform CRA_c n=1 Tax=Rattus norvegicus TaxID=10116 RepID=A6IY47_RAT|nr:rCG51106, isoform CRA_c [Rattus norvegicus]EDL92176.1 rCG51106, isoform CRA_c [Rattus norvegicus]